MPIELIPVLAAEAVYLAACLIYGARPGAAAWLRWPHTFWARLHGYGPPSAAATPRPDYAKIRRLERELGLEEPQAPIRAEKVCLVKGCSDADIIEHRSWSGMLLHRVHEH